MESKIALPGFLFIGPVRVSRLLEDPTTYNRSEKKVLPRGMNGGLRCILGRRALLPEPAEFPKAKKKEGLRVGRGCVQQTQVDNS